MKTFLAAILTSALLGLGLVAATSGPASAACPYTACITSVTAAKAKPVIAAGTKENVKATVAASGTTLKPTGALTLKVKKVGGGYLLSKTFTYSGGTVKVKTAKLKKGKYVAKATFVPAANSIFNGSSDKATFTVK